MSLVDLGDPETRVARSARIVNVLDRAVNFVLKTSCEISLCGSLVAVGLVVNQSVPAAHDGDSSFAHCVFAFVFCEVELDVGCLMLNENLVLRGTFLG